MAYSCISIRSISEFKALYKQIEKHSIITPYDQLIWIENWFTTFSAVNGHSFFGLLVTENENPILILPLIIENKTGFKKAKFLGDKHGNFHFPIVHNNYHIFTSEQADLISNSIKLCLKINNIDILILERMLESYRNTKNILFNISSNYIEESLLYCELTNNFDEFAAQRRQGAAAKRDRKQIAGITKLGTWTCYEAKTKDERQEILDAFYRFKPVRLAHKGVKNLFNDKNLQEFIGRMAFEKIGDHYPMSLSALKLNNNIIALSCNLEHNLHASGLFNTIDPSYQDIIQPGYVLLRFEIQHYCNSNFNLFDLGVGEARYKRTWLRDEWKIRTVIVPLSLIGHIIAGIEFGKYALMHHIKNSKILWNFVRKLRKIKISVIKIRH